MCRKGNPCAPWQGCKSVRPLYKVCCFLKKLKIKLLFDKTIPLPVICAMEI